MVEPESLTLTTLQRLDAKLDRVQSTLDDHTQRLLRLERRLLDRDGEALRQDEAMARFDQRLATPRAPARPRRRLMARRSGDTTLE